jgi:putative thiamine transport system ATP-binding protein
MLELDGIRIATPQRTLIDGLSARVGPGELLVVMSESGSGKSSLLSFLCGTLAPGLQASGSVRLDGREVTALPTAQRRIGILFQDDLLFPHLTVLENLLFALPAGPAVERRAEAEAALGSAGLAGYGERWPHTLSGGQRSRVSVLRALLARPQALLLDEPFSRLDMALRQRFRSFVFERLRAQGVPAVLVTHDAHDVPEGARVIRLEEPIDSTEDSS